MRRLLKSMLDIHRGEILVTLLMFVSYYLIMVTYYFLKPARDSLFLTKVSPEQLPVVFIVTAIVTAPVVALYSGASRTLKLNRLISVTLTVLIANLIILRWLVQINQPWVYYLFYTWVSIYGALTTSQFWLLANAIYDSSQAKRLFALFGLAGIAGAVTGGEVTSLLVEVFSVSTENLLFICSAVVVIVIALVALTWARRPIDQAEAPRRQLRRKPQGDKISDLVKTVFGNRHLAITVGIVASAMMVASFVDYQFKTVSFQAFSEKAELTSFLGKFYSRLSIVSLTLQLLFTYRFVRWLGVGGIIMFLPISLLFGSVAMFAYPGLIAAVLLRGADGSIKYSLDKTGRELLFLPVPIDMKKRTKVFIDLFVDRWFRGLAGGLLLLCTMVLEVTQVFHHHLVTEMDLLISGHYS